MIRVGAFALLIITQLVGTSICFSQPTPPQELGGVQGPNAAARIHEGVSKPSISLSPSEQAIGGYVNMFSGAAQFEIPLENIVFHDISVPISLSYDYNGFRPNEHPSWVGLGWTLNAGGIIKRRRNGEADEARVPTWGEYSYIFSPFRSDMQFVDGVPPQNNYDSYLGKMPVTDLTATNPTGCAFDSEPDEFTFSIGNLNGTFFYDNSNPGKWVVRSNSDVYFEVEAEYNSNSGTDPNQYYEFLNPNIKLARYIKKFTITTGDGIKYTFGGIHHGTTRNIEFDLQAPTNKYGTSDAGVGNHIYVSSWHLAKIETPNHTAVNFSYEAYGQTAELSPNFNLEFWNGNPGNPNANPPIPAISTVYGMRSNYNTYSVKLTTRTYLKQITAGDRKVTFESTPTKIYYANMGCSNQVGSHFFEELPVWSERILTQNVLSSYLNRYPGVVSTHEHTSKYVFDHFWRKLDYITFSTNNIFDKRINFEYYKFSKFSNCDSIYDGSKTGRLELKRVYLEPDATPTISPQMTLHSFEYYGNYINSLDTPYYVPYGTRAVDHWGFSNYVDYFKPGGYYLDTMDGAYRVNSGNVLSIEQAYSSSRNSFLYSQPNPPSHELALGALHKMTNSLGGTTEFEYERNAYSGYMRLNTTGGEFQNGTSNNLSYVATTATSAGGIRVKKITQYPSTNPSNLYQETNGDPIEKHYYYIKGYNGSNMQTATGSGCLGGDIPKYIVSPANEDKGYSMANCPNPNANGNPTTDAWFIWTNNPTHPLNENFRVTYGEVVEKTTSAGYTIFKYSNHNSDASNKYKDELEDFPIASTNSAAQYACNGTGPAFTCNGYKFRAIKNKDLERGRLLNRSFYNNQNNLVKTIDYIYNTSDSRFLQQVKYMKRLGHVWNAQFLPVNNFLSIKSFVARKFFYHNYLESVIETDYINSGGTVQSNIANYAYDEYRNLVSKKVNRSNATSLKDSFRYAHNADFQLSVPTADPFAEGIKYLRNHTKIKNALIEQFQILTDDAGSRVIGGQINAYENPNVLPTNKYQLQIQQPISLSTYIASKIDQQSHQFSFLPQYTQRQRISNWYYGNVNQVIDDEIPSASLRDHYQTLVTATATHCLFSDLHFTSFEGNYNGINASNKGNWEFDESQIDETKGMGGNRSLNLSSQSITASDLIPGKRYRVICWTGSTSGTNSLQFIDGSNTFISNPVSNVVTHQGVDWRMYIAEFVATSATLIVQKLPGGAPTVYVDELRLSPAESIVNTFTYDRLHRLESVSDSRGHFIRYGYGDFDRLILERDHQFNIIKKYEYGVRTQE